MRSIRSVVTVCICALPGLFATTPATAANYDGYWSLIAQTTNGHCGAHRFDVVIGGGRLNYPGGFSWATRWVSAELCRPPAGFACGSWQGHASGTALASLPGHAAAALGPGRGRLGAVREFGLPPDFGKFLPNVLSAT